MVDVIEEFSDIAFEGITDPRAIPAFFLKHLRKHIYSSMTPFAYTAGEGCCNKCRLENRIEHAEYGMVQNPVSYYGFVNVPTLRISDEESCVWPMLVCAALQFLIQLEDVRLKVSLEFHHIRAGPFTMFQFFPR